MKKIFYFLFIIFLWNVSFSQEETYIQIDDFSENYYATVYIKDSLSFYNNQLSEVEITIHERYVTEKRVHTQRDKINVSDAQLRLKDLENISFVSSADSHYRLGTIIYDDFNFDGNWDFAIKYRNGETCENNFYKVYLSDGKNFHYSESFTNLAKEQCSMFRIDRVKKELFTEKYDNNIKVKNEYIVENGKNLVLVKSTAEKSNSNALFTDITIKELKGKKYVTTHTTDNMLDAEGVYKVLSFKNAKGKKANIFVYYNADMYTCNLGYMLLDAKGNVEFSYPMLERTKSDFTYDKNQNTLVFENKDSKYTIYENADKVGIKIISNGKRYNWVGEPKTKEGNLAKLDTLKIINMVKK